MRLVEILIPTRKREAVEDVLEDEGIDYTLVEEHGHSEPSVVITFPLPAPAVESVLDSLRETGIDEDSYTVIVEAETVVSEQFEDLERRYARNTDRISREEMQAKARELTPRFSTYLVMTIMSVVVATAGLLLDSPAVVVGSMVIAPLIGPAMASCVGTVINDDDLFWEGIRSQVIGLAVAVLSGVVFALSYRFLLAPELELLLIQQIAERAHPGLLALAVALGAGTAGALALTSGADEALVGVMIAVALMPPAASVGLGVAYVDPRLAFGASVLVLVNLLSINVAGIVTIWIKRYKPSHWYDAQQARRITAERLVVFALAIFVLTSFLAMSSLDARDNMAFESQVEAIAEETTDELLAVDVQYHADLVSQQPSGVTVYVHGDEPPAASELRERINAETGVDVPVTVITEQADVA